MLAITLALAVAAPLFGSALGLLLPQSAEAHAAGIMIEEIVLWGLPALALRKRHAAKGRFSPVIGAAALGLGACLQAAVAVLLTMLKAGGQTLTLPSTRAEWALTVLAMVVVPAVCEEAFFRGALLGVLEKRWGTVGACAASAVLFALMHGDLTGLAGQLAVGVMAGVLTLYTGNIGCAILGHLGYNGAALALAGCPQMDVLGLLGLVWLAGVAVVSGRLQKRAGKRVTAMEAALTLAIVAVALVRLR